MDSRANYIIEGEEIVVKEELGTAKRHIKPGRHERGFQEITE